MLGARINFVHNKHIPTAQQKKEEKRWMIILATTTYIAQNMFCFHTMLYDFCTTADLSSCFCFFTLCSCPYIEVFATFSIAYHSNMFACAVFIKFYIIFQSQNNVTSKTPQYSNYSRYISRYSVYICCYFLFWCCCCFHSLCKNT